MYGRVSMQIGESHMFQDRQLIIDERSRIAIIGAGEVGCEILGELLTVKSFIKSMKDVLFVQAPNLHDMGAIVSPTGDVFKGYLLREENGPLESELSGVERTRGGDDEHWLDHRLLLLNEEYRVLQDIDLTLVKWVENIVEALDMMYIIADLEQSSYSIALLFDALCTKHEKKNIFFLIRPDSVLGGQNLNYYNNRVQLLSKAAECAIMVPEKVRYDPHELADILMGLNKLIFWTGTVNIDLADIKSIAGLGNVGMMGVGRGRGLSKAAQASDLAITHSMLDIELPRIRQLIICVIGGEDMTVVDSKLAAQNISDILLEESKLIWGAYVDREMEGRMEMVLLVGLTANQALTKFQN